MQALGLQRPVWGQGAFEASAEFGLSHMLTLDHGLDRWSGPAFGLADVGAGLLVLGGDVQPQLAAQQASLVAGGGLGRPRALVLAIGRVALEASVRTRPEPWTLTLLVVDRTARRGRQLQQAIPAASRQFAGQARGDDAFVEGARRLQPAARRRLAHPHDIGDQGAALHIDARRAGADQLDADDRPGRDAPQDGLQAFGLAGGASAVDQHVAGRAGKAPHVAVAAVEGETGRRPSMSNAE